MSNLMGVSQHRFDVLKKDTTFVGGRPDHILHFLSTLRIDHCASGSREFHTTHLTPSMPLGICLRICVSILTDASTSQHQYAP
jgi:hypothetical protein